MYNVTLSLYDYYKRGVAFRVTLMSKTTCTNNKY